MRERGVLRRALLVHTAAAAKRRSNPTTVAPDALQKTAKLCRTFSARDQEQQLEETDMTRRGKSGRRRREPTGERSSRC